MAGTVEPLAPLPLESRLSRIPHDELARLAAEAIAESLDLT